MRKTTDKLVGYGYDMEIPVGFLPTFFRDSATPGPRCSSSGISVCRFLGCSLFGGLPQRISDWAMPGTHILLSHTLSSI